MSLTAKLLLDTLARAPSVNDVAAWRAATYLEIEAVIAMAGHETGKGPQAQLMHCPVSDREHARTPDCEESGCVPLAPRPRGYALWALTELCSLHFGANHNSAALCRELAAEVFTPEECVRIRRALACIPGNFSELDFSILAKLLQEQ